MTTQEIQKDRGDRADACKKELEAILGKYQFAMAAEDNWTPNTKVSVQISFVDLKKYDADVAELATPKVNMTAGQSATPTSPKETIVEPIVPEGRQLDGSVVINPADLKA